ncbi:MAG: efflux RND transporter periplasmic adaptor subunit [Omnitrophica bacterium]|nr:efflux RND transporter periplasmic adaptor subunit [Candidatus Omnitrophota bacterium]
MLLIVLIGMVVINTASKKSSNPLLSNNITFKVQRGPLIISVTESGTIKAREQIILKSEVEGRTSILSLIPEGTRVKKGDLLVELDSSSLLDNKIDQEIRVQNAEASFIRARENLAVVENQAESDIDKAELKLEFADQDLEKYIEGDYPNQLKEAQARITLTKEELTRAKEQLKWSVKLSEKEYISKTELEADELAVTRKALDLELTENDLNLLENFTYKRNFRQFESDAKQAGMALERTTRKSKADIIQAQADLRARESEFKRQKDKLEKIGEQIIKTKIYAPADGLVIYATSAKRGGWRGSTEPLDEGQDVRERQELIYLPTASAMKAEVNIHETNLKKINPGLPVTITVDALPGKIFTGHVTHIAPLPDAQSMWMNPDLKVYNTDIFLDSNDEALRTGMSCKAQIIIEKYNDAIFVPIQAVLRVAGEPTVYVSNSKSFEPRKVKIGLDNNMMIRILSGLKAGEIVLLTPPLSSAGIGVEASSDKPAGQTSEPRVQADDRDTEKKERPRNRQHQREGRENMTDEQRKKMREKYEKMTPEEREKLKKQFRGKNN